MHFLPQKYKGGAIICLHWHVQGGNQKEKGKVSGKK
jgi:hypothetical protein